MADAGDRGSRKAIEWLALTFAAAAVGAFSWPWPTYTIAAAVLVGALYWRTVGRWIRDWWQAPRLVRVASATILFVIVVGAGALSKAWSRASPPITTKAGDRLKVAWSRDERRSDDPIAYIDIVYVGGSTALYGGVPLFVVGVELWLEETRRFVEQPVILLKGSQHVRVGFSETMFPGFPYSLPLLGFWEHGGTGPSLAVQGIGDADNPPPAIYQSGRWRVRLRAEFSDRNEEHELCFEYLVNRPPVPIPSCPESVPPA